MKPIQLVKKMKTYKLFVYGTLKMEPRDTHYISGKMWNVGQFPCIKLGGLERITGQLIDVTDIDLGRLDRYENVPVLYTREKTVAYKVGKDGTGQEVYIYEWARETNDLRRIAGWDDGKTVGL